MVEFHCLCDVSYHSFKYIAVIAKGRHAKAETARHCRK